MQPAKRRGRTGRRPLALARSKARRRYDACGSVGARHGAAASSRVRLRNSSWIRSYIPDEFANLSSERVKIRNGHGPRIKKVRHLIAFCILHTRLVYFSFRASYVATHRFPGKCRFRIIITAKCVAVDTIDLSLIRYLQGIFNIHMGMLAIAIRESR